MPPVLAGAAVWPREKARMTLMNSCTSPPTIADLRRLDRDSRLLRRCLMFEPARSAALLGLPGRGDAGLKACATRRCLMFEPARSAALLALPGRGDAGLKACATRRCLMFEPARSAALLGLPGRRDAA